MGVKPPTLLLCMRIQCPQGTVTQSGQMQIPGPSRRCLCDWVSLTSRVENLKELNKVKDTAEKVLSDNINTRQTVPLKSAGNYLDGIKWEKFGASLRWSSETAADLIGANYVGRCVNTVNLQLRGGTGIGSLRLTHASSILEQLVAIGMDSCRRLDLSIDVFNHPELTVRSIAEHLKEGDWKMPRRNPANYIFHGPLIDGGKTRKGSTLYIGTKDSDVQVVIYDKGAQQETSEDWIRFEVRYKDEPAGEALYRLLQYQNSAMESPDPPAFLDKAVVGMVRSACDIRDVSRYKGLASLPKNWAQSSLTSYPDVMHPVFAETAPLQIGSFKAANTFASRTRHLMRSSSKHIWRLAVISMAKGENPGSVALTMGAPGAHEISDEDFSEMSQCCGHTIKQLEAAEVACHTELCKLHGIDAECIASDRSRMREEFARSLGGV